MRTLSTLALVLGLIVAANAQGVITRIGSDGTHFYYDGLSDLQQVFDDATINGLGPDTILFGGGAFNLTADLMITSPVIAIGTGLRGDSAVAYGVRTEFLGFNRRITLMHDADGSEFHGLTFATGNALRFGDSYANSDVDEVKFFRCQFNLLDLGGSGGSISLANDILVEQCVINSSLNVSGASDVLVRNTFLGDAFNATGGSPVMFRNCIFLEWDEIGSSSGVGYENNIFLNTWTAPLSVNIASVYSNNLFVGNGVGFTTLNFDVDVTASNNYLRIALADVFANVTSPNGYGAYELNSDYHVTDGTLLGTDGNQVGIYGGDAAWKDGSLPFNPHWSLLSTPANTVNGLLTPVQIRASAQTH